MGIFSKIFGSNINNIITNDMGIDLGTANTLVYIKGQGIVVDEPSVVAIRDDNNEILAVGQKARDMVGRTPENIVAIQSVKEGVIADFEATQAMMSYFIQKGSKGVVSPRIVICVPYGITKVEKKAIEEAAIQAGGREVFILEEPMAAAIGAGLNVNDPEGNMIVDIGGGSTEIAVISLGGIVCNNSIRVAGDDLTADIQEYMSRQHNVRISERMAERIKLHVGSALTDLGSDAPEDYVVHGPNRITALPMEVPVCYQEVAHSLDKTVAKIENAVLSALENTPPELYADIVKNGIYLSGGGALLRGIDRRLTEKINIKFHIAEDPLHSVAKGAGIALKNVERFSFLMR